MSNAYTPREGSVAWKVVEFLTMNPEESLDADIISAKFDADRRNVHTLLGPSVQAGLLQRSEDLESGELVYARGKAEAPASQAVPAQKATGFHGWLERKGETSAEGRAARRATAPVAPETPPPTKKRNGPFWIDPKTVRIDKGVQMAGRSAAIDWSPLLDALEVGDSFLLPSAAKSAISTAMKAYKDATKKVLISRKVEDGIRVWRAE